MKAYLDILKLVWPLALGMVNNAVMQFVDRAYLARYSKEALEAVLPAGTLAWVFLIFFQSVVGYSGVFVAQFHGAGDRSGEVVSFRAGKLIALLAGVIVIGVIPIGNLIFSATALFPKLIPMEQSYFDIMIGGGVLLFLQMAAISYFTGIGRSRIVFWVNLIGNLINIALDPLLIYGWCGFPKLGIAGAALATVASMAVQAIVMLVAAHRATASVSRYSWNMLWAMVKRVLAFGVPSGGYEVLNMLSFTIFVFITGRIGEVAFAASNACFTVNYLLFAPMVGFALGVQTLVGQSRGRKDDEGARLALSRTLKLAIGFTVVVSAVVLILHTPVLSLFAPSDQIECDGFMKLGVRLLIIMTAWLVFDCADIVLSGALKGAGDTRFVFWWMLICGFGLWLPSVALVFHYVGTMEALWATLVGHVLLVTIGSWWRWRCGRWKDIKVVFDIDRVKPSAH